MEASVVERVLEIKESRSVDEVNQLLATGAWIVLEVKVEKTRKPVGKEKVGIEGAGNWNLYKIEDKFEIKYEENLESLYVLGRVK